MPIDQVLARARRNPLGPAGDDSAAFSARLRATPAPGWGQQSAPAAVALAMSRRAVPRPGAGLVLIAVPGRMTAARRRKRA